MIFKQSNNKINFKLSKNNKISFFYLSRIYFISDFKILKNIFVLFLISKNCLLKFDKFVSFKLLFFLFNKTNLYQIFNKFKTAKARSLADLSLSEDKATISYLLNKLFYNFEIKFNQNLFYNFNNSLKIFIFLFFYYFFEKKNLNNSNIEKFKYKKINFISRSKKKWKKFKRLKRLKKLKRIKKHLFSKMLFMNKYFIKNVLTIKNIFKKTNFVFTKSSDFFKLNRIKNIKIKKRFIKNFKFFLYDTIYFKSLSKNKLDILDSKKLSKPQLFFIKKKILFKKKTLKADFPISQFCGFFKKERRFRFINFLSNFAIITLNYTGSNIFINISVVFQKIALTIAFFSGVC